MIFSKKLSKIPNLFVIGLVWIYQKTLSPSLGIFRFIPFYPKNTCIFYPTCSEYCIQSFKKYPFLKALLKSVNRIRRCHPHNEPGIDLP